MKTKPKPIPRLTADESLLLEFARRQLAFDRALVAYNRSPLLEGPEANALDVAFRELREIRPRLAAVQLVEPPAVKPAPTKRTVTA